MPIVLQWVILPLMAALFLGYFEAQNRKAESDELPKLKDHQRSWWFNEGRAVRKKAYAAIVGLAAVANVVIMVFADLKG